MSNNVTCPYCGHTNPLQAKFCIKCGKPITYPAEPSRPPQAGSLRIATTILLILVLATSIFLPWWGVKINAPLPSGELITISPSGLKGAAAQLAQYIGKEFVEPLQVEQINAALHRFLAIAVIPIILSAVALVTRKEEINLLSGITGIAVFILFIYALSSKLKEYRLSIHGSETIEIMGFKLGRISWGLKVGAYLYLLASIALIITALILRGRREKPRETQGFSEDLSP